MNGRDKGKRFETEEKENVEGNVNTPSAFFNKGTATGKTINSSEDGLALNIQDEEVLKKLLAEIQELNKVNNGLMIGMKGLVKGSVEFNKKLVLLRENAVSVERVEKQITDLEEKLGTLHRLDSPSVGGYSPTR